MSQRRPGAKRDQDFLIATIRRKRRRKRLDRRKRFGRLVATGVLAVLIALVISGFTGAAVWMNSCDLNTLRPVNVGQNSFVYAADGSLLGSIPAEKNRQPVELARDEQVGGESNGRDRGSTLLVARRARLCRHRPRALREHPERDTSCRAGRPSRSSSRATSTSRSPRRPSAARPPKRVLRSSWPVSARSAGSSARTSTRCSTATARTGSRLRRRRTSPSARSV